MKGDTVVYGVLEALDDGLATLRVTGTGARLSVSYEPSQADGLQARHGTEVGLAGEATWDMADGWAMTHLRLREITPYQETPITEAFAALREVLGPDACEALARTWETKCPTCLRPEPRCDCDKEEP